MSVGREIDWLGLLNGDFSSSLSTRKTMTSTMANRKKTSTWLSVLVLSALGIWVSPAEVLPRTSEVERALNPVLSSYDVLRFEPGEIEQQIREDGELTFRFDDTDFQFDLEPHNMRAPGYRAMETGPGGVRRTLPPQPVHTFKGRLVGPGETRGRFNITGNGVEGVVYDPKGWVYLEPLRNYLPGAPAGELVVYRHAKVKPDEDFRCGGSLPERLQRGIAQVEARTQTKTSDSPINYVADLATEADYEYVQALGGSAEANREIEGILNLVAEVYQSELLLQLQISFQHTWDTADDPYTATTTRGLLTEFTNHWEANFASEKDYDLAHMWTDRERTNSSVGSTFLSVVCRDRDRSYGATVRFESISRKYHTPAHSIGHSFGATDTYKEDPSIVACGQTIMSFGRTTMSIRGWGTFCQFSRDQIATYLADNNSCLETQAITLQPPSGLSATAASSSSINLTWEDNSTNETGFLVQRRRLGSGMWVQLGTTAADARAFTSDGLFSEYPYIYRVQAVNDSESSAFSNEAEATTLAGTAVVADWRIHTLAGGSNGDGGPAVQAKLEEPSDVAVDSSGNLYITDYRNNRIRKVNTSGIITTVAGTGVGGYSGDGGSSIKAMLNRPAGIVVDSSGNLYIADARNHRIRKVDTSGTITTIAGTGEEGFSGDGGPATAARLDSPTDLAVDSPGNLYIADNGNHRIRRVDTSGTITSVAGTGVEGYSGDGNKAVEARLHYPSDVEVDTSGNLYINDSHNERIRRVDTSGTITTVAGTGEEGFSGDGGPAVQARLDPTSVSIDGAGNLYIGHASFHRIRRVDTTGTITTIAGTGSLGYSGDGGPATRARLYQPGGVAVDSSGNIYIADSFNHRIRRVDTSGTITTVAGTVGDFIGDGGPATGASLNDPAGIAVDSSGNLYIADSGNHRIRRVDTSGTITTVAGTGERGYSGDRGTAVAAKLAWPRGVAVDGAGVLYIADTNNNRVRRVDSQGIITSFVTGLHSPRGLAVDGSGNVYIADHADQIRKVDSSGTLTTIAGTGEDGYSGDGGPATEAWLSNPESVAVDNSGNIYVTDNRNERIRILSTDTTAPTVESIAIASDPLKQATYAGGGSHPGCGDLQRGGGSGGDPAVDDRGGG